MPSVAMITSLHATSAVLPAKVRPLTTAISGTRPAELRERGERMRIDRDARADIILARPAAAAFAEQHQRQTEAVPSSNIRSCL